MKQLSAIILMSMCTGGALAGDPVDFATVIQPILASRCVKCHGAQTQEAGLKFTELKAASARLSSGKRAVAPGDVQASELLHRVSSTDLDIRMPPEGPSLQKGEIAVLKKWIQQGARWPAHWAYQPLSKPGLPSIQQNEAIRPTSPIDYFVFAQLQRRGLNPSPIADKRTLLRRVYIDLIGLPPTSAEYRSFMADASPDAYHKVVQQLLSSPRYGERWARHWMDVVHFAESHGHDQDRPRPNAWPYRDYLIDSFNKDKKYGRFVAEQIAGDGLYPNSPSAIVATGLLASGSWDESSLRDIREDSIDRQIARYIDRDDIVTTVMSTFMSTTVHCARCHDHKFDPISQEEYYRLQAVFAGTDKGNRLYDVDPNIAIKRREIQQRLRLISSQMKLQNDSFLTSKVKQQVFDWEKTFGKIATGWKVATPVTWKSNSGSKLQKTADDALLASGPRSDKDIYTIVIKAAESSVTAIRFEVLDDKSLPKNGPGRSENGNLHLNEFRAWSTSNAFDASDNDASDNGAAVASNPAPLEWSKVTSDFDQAGWTIQHAVDGNPDTAWGVFPKVGQPHHAIFVLKRPLTLQKSAIMKSVGLKIELQQTHGRGHLIGKLRISTTSSPNPDRLATVKLPHAILSILSTPAGQRSNGQRIQLASYVLKEKLQKQLKLLPPPQVVYCGSSRFQTDASFRPVERPRQVNVLRRGEITQPLSEAHPGVLSCLPEMANKLNGPLKTDEQRRAALGRWIIDRKNVLTWRSIANRIWLYHFGRAIVDTPNDFGRLGRPPTHPNLLNWLATEMRDHQSFKRLHYLIVTSHTYRQSSRSEPRAVRVDADNRYLWRMNRRRLDAESLRDSVLQIANNLDLKMRGPSVKHFIQTPGVHVTPVANYLGFDVDDPGLRRRSVYRFVFRTVPDPFMDALDCPDGSQLTPKRNASLTPLQSLALLNDKFIIRQSQFVASRIARKTANLDEQVDELFQLVLARRPDPEERSLVIEYSEKHGVANACKFLLNSNEFVFVD